MDLEDIRRIESEAERVGKIYEIFNEDRRLNRGQAARVEFLTTVRYIEKYLRPGARLLDIGAGAGEYSLYFAGQGCRVSSLELAERNIEAFRKKIRPDDKIELRRGNALELSCYEDESFDCVLLMGPLYHLESFEDRLKCVLEAKRVCKRDGKMFFSFISHDFLFLTEFCYDNEFFLKGSYDRESLRLEDFPFVFSRPGECIELLETAGIRLLHSLATDGASELLEELIDKMDPESYSQYLRYHFSICEKPEFLGMSSHLLFVGEK